MTSTDDGTALTDGSPKSLHARPIALKAARVFVGEEHRHNPVMGIQRWALAAHDDANRLVGVVVVGNPKARMLQHPARYEVTRLATDGTPNACSFLYGAAMRTARAMGIWSLKTYTLLSEPGASLRAVRAKDEGEVREEDWDRRSRRRTSKHTIAPRRRWELLRDSADLCEKFPLSAKPSASRSSENTHPVSSSDPKAGQS